MVVLAQHDNQIGGVGAVRDSIAPDWRQEVVGWRLVNPVDSIFETRKVLAIDHTQNVFAEAFVYVLWDIFDARET